MNVLFLVRHGKAVTNHPEGDRHRSLSAEGRLRIEGMLPEVFQRDFRVDLALSSPYLRAVQTRDLFLPAMSGPRLEVSTALRPESDPEDAFLELQAWAAQGFHRLAVFTHNPFVTDLAERLLVPGSVTSLCFHTPTILALAFDEALAWRQGRPLWMLHP